MASFRGPTAWERLSDQLFRLLAWLAGWLVVASLVMVGFQVLYAAWPAIQQFGLTPLAQTDWDPNPDNEQFGLLPAIVGTLLTSLSAIFAAGFFGVLTAILVGERFLPPRIAAVLAALVDLLAAVPSVIYGLWGTVVVAPIIQTVGVWLHTHFGWFFLFATAPSGRSMLASSVVLAIMVLPTVASLSRDALAATPQSLRMGAWALGATRWETILKVVLPAAMPGIVAAMLLGLGRAIGETMAVTMLIGNKAELSWSILSPASTLTTLIANHMQEASGVQASMLMLAAATLMVLTLGLNIIGERLGRRFSSSAVRSR